MAVGSVYLYTANISNACAPLSCLPNFVRREKVCDAGAEQRQKKNKSDMKMFFHVYMLFVACLCACA